MSEDQSIRDDGSSPRFEPWVAVICSAFIPAGATLLLPGRFLLPLVVVTAALFAAGLVMLSRQGRKADQ